MQIFENRDPKELAKEWLAQEGSTEDSVMRSLTRLRGLCEAEAWDVICAVREESVYERILLALEECYLNAEPPIDLKTTTQEVIKPNEHIIANSKFSEILKKYNVKISDSIFLFVNKFPKMDMSK